MDYVEQVESCFCMFKVVLVLSSVFSLSLLDLV